MSDSLKLDPRNITGKPRILLYSSCVAEQLQTSFLSDPRVRDRFAIDAVLIHVIECSSDQELREYKHASVFQNADIIFTNCFSPKWEKLGINSVMELKRQSSPIFTWTPPNFSAFWALDQHHGKHGVVKMIEKGCSLEEIKHSFDSGTFDPMFKERWDEQIARIKQRDSNSDVGISDFIERNYKREKMFFTENHPAYTVVSWIAEGLLEKIGLCSRDEGRCLSVRHDMTSTWNAWPETHYEFNYYGFTYPMRYKTTPWGDDWFHQQIDEIWKSHKK